MQQGIGDRDEIFELTKKFENFTKDIPAEWSPRQRIMSERRGDVTFVQVQLSLRVPVETDK